MANPRMQVSLTPFNIVIGVILIVLALVVFAWLLPLVLPAEAMYVISAVVIGILLWYLAMVARKRV